MPFYNKIIKTAKLSRWDPKTAILLCPCSGGRTGFFWDWWQSASGLLSLFLVVFWQSIMYLGKETHDPDPCLQSSCYSPRASAYVLFIRTPDILDWGSTLFWYDLILSAPITLIGTLFLNRATCWGSQCKDFQPFAWEPQASP